MTVQLEHTEYVTSNVNALRVKLMVRSASGSSGFVINWSTGSRHKLSSPALGSIPSNCSHGGSRLLRWIFWQCARQLRNIIQVTTAAAVAGRLLSFPHHEYILSHTGRKTFPSHFLSPTPHLHNTVDLLVAQRWMPLAGVIT